jgi:hypothetical protein
VLLRVFGALGQMSCYLPSILSQSALGQKIEGEKKGDLLPNGSRCRRGWRIPCRLLEGRRKFRKGEDLYALRARTKKDFMVSTRLYMGAYNRFDVCIWSVLFDQLFGKCIQFVVLGQRA